MYAAYEIPSEVFKQISELFPPQYPDIIGHHVTVEFGVSADYPIPEEAEITLIYYMEYVISGYVDCFIVHVNGEMMRPDGGVYHLTWSIDRSKGAKPVDSNDLIRLMMTTTSHDYNNIPISNKKLKRNQIRPFQLPVIEPFIAKGKIYT